MHELNRSKVAPAYKFHLFKTNFDEIGGNWGKPSFLRDYEKPLMLGPYLFNSFFSLK